MSDVSGTSHVAIRLWSRDNWSVIATETLMGVLNSGIRIIIVFKTQLLASLNRHLQAIESCSFERKNSAIVLPIVHKAFTIQAYG